MAGHQRSRRDFFQQAAMSASALALSTQAVQAQESSRRSSRSAEPLRLAFIGVGGRGLRNLLTMTNDPQVEVAAICDVDQHRLQVAQERFPKARSYRDFRELYQTTNDIDAVVVSTAEHTHAYATLPALRLGKHVYCEKPLTYNIAEARLIAEAAAQAKVATQMGTQIHAGNNYHRVVELIQSGAIGAVNEVHVWVGRAWGLQSLEESQKHKDIVYVTDRPREVMQPPATLDWDLWLGPAPERPFHEVYFPGPKWYRWWDFGNGTMSDLGSHWNDLPYWALKLDAPHMVEASGPPPHAEIAPASMTSTYHYAARNELPPCRLTWYQGTHKPPLWLERKIPQWNSGVLFVGSQGMLLSDYSKHVLLPEEKFRDFTPPEPFIPDSPGHHEEWLAACRTGSATASPFSYAGPLTEANHLGNVAYRAGGRIEWDVSAMRITNLPEASRFVARTPRDGWSLG